MFKTAATKIAHNSTIPALAGNQELRPLQDLITAEKAVLISLQKLSVDFSKAAEALRTWGLCEGDDLGDILSASTTVLNHFSNAVSQYAAHGHAIREHLKAIRTREENLEEMKRRRRTVFKKADDADKKLNKMSPEHKNLQMQAEILNRLREDIRTLDTDIVIEEAALGDFKRTVTRMWMGLKFGGLMECCQKGRIAATFGEMVISEISEEQTQPGLHRAFYQGQAKTEALVADAHRAVNEITLSTIPSIGFRDRREYYGGRDVGPAAFLNDKPMPSVPREISELTDPPSRLHTNDVSDPGSPSTLLQKPHSWPQNDQPGIPRPFGSDGPGSPSSVSQKISPWSPNYESLAVQAQRTVDDFGVNPRLTSIQDREASGGRFATFPVKARSPGSDNLTLLDPLPLQSRHDLGPSFASSIADALDHTDNPLEDSRTPLPVSTIPASSPNVAAPPQALATNPWADDQEGGNGRKLRSNTVDTETAVLAYMMSADDDPGLDEPPRASFQASSGVTSTTFEDGMGQLRIGNSVDVDREVVKRSSFEKDRQQRPIPIMDAEALHDRGAEPLKTHEHSPGARASEISIRPVVEFWPSPEDHEKELNAAAAREITLELEALNAGSEELSLRSSVDSTIERGRLLAGQGDYEGISREPSPLAPPSAPFTRRSISPHPYPDLHSMTPHPSPSGDPYSASQPYGQSYGPSTSYGGLSQSSHPVWFQLPGQSGLSVTPGYQTSRLQSGSSPLSSSPITLSASKSNASLNSAGIVTSTRTISAAAFRRPRNKSTDNYEDPRGLPSTLYPLPRVPSGTADPGSMIPPPTDNRLSHASSEFDYIDAYMMPSAPNTPQKMEFTTASSPTSGGYGTGKFSTDLEGNLR